MKRYRKDTTGKKELYQLYIDRADRGLNIRTGEPLTDEEKIDMIKPDSAEDALESTSFSPDDTLRA